MVAAFSDAALPPRGDARVLVCAHLRLAPDGFRLGAEGGFSVGCVAADRDRRNREDCFQHLAFWRFAANANFGRPRRPRPDGFGWGDDASAVTGLAWGIPCQAAFV